MARTVTTLKIWNRAAAHREARHLLMQAGLRRAGDLTVLRRATNADASPLPCRVPLADPHSAVPLTWLS